MFSNCETVSWSDCLLARRVDHLAVCADMTLGQPISDVAPPVKDKFVYDKTALHDPDRCHRFRKPITTGYAPLLAETINEQLEHLNQFVRDTAVQCFGRPRNVAKKPWISP